MDITVGRLRARTVEAIQASMKREIANGEVELYGKRIIHGKRIINAVTFKDINDPVRFVGDKAIQFSEHSYVLLGLAKRLDRYLKNASSTVAR